MPSLISRCLRPAFGPALVLLISAGTLFACESTPVPASKPVPEPQPVSDTATVEDEPVEILTDVLGQVVKVGNIGFGLVPDDAPGTRYAPTEPLAEELQVDGLKVRFSGEVGDPDDIPGRGRRWGTPLKVTAIEKVEDAADGAAEAR